VRGGVQPNEMIAKRRTRIALSAEPNRTQTQHNTTDHNRSQHNKEHETHTIIRERERREQKISAQIIAPKERERTERLRDE